MNLIKRIYRKLFPKKRPVIKWTHYYENARKETVLCTILKRSRGVVHVINENYVELKLKPEQIDEIPKFR